MKKILLVFVLVLSLLMCLTACFDSDDDIVITISNKNEEKEVNKINTLLGKESSKVNLNITTKTGNAELESRYEITKSSVKYYVENLATLPTDGDFSNLSDDPIKVLQGTATVENGAVTKLNGDNVELPSYTNLTGAFKLSKTNLKNLEVESGVLEADVISASEFFGATLTVTDMHLRVEYGENSIQKLTVSYKTSISDVILVYNFT